MLTTARLFVLILFCPVLLTAQVVQDKNPSEANEKLRKEAVAFLRETVADVNAMRSLENRISFTAEMAGLMWFHDEREARGMYNGAITDYRDLVARYDAQINALGVTMSDNESGGGFLSFMSEPTDKSRILRKFMTAVSVGQQIAMSLAEHDPELAYSFYYDTIASISNPEFRKQTESGTSYFEAQLLSEIAEKNAGKAAQLAARGLGKGFNYQHLELLKKIYAKDADKGAEFGAAIRARLKVEKFDSSDFYMLGSLLDFGSETLEASRKPGGRRPVYTLAELREIAELMAQEILRRNEGDGISGLGYIDMIQKYAPGRAAQIRAKFRRSVPPPNSMANAMNTAANAASYSGYSNSSSNSNVARSEEQRREREERDRAEKKLFDDVQSLGTKQLPKEERDKIVAQSRKIIMQVPGREKKIMSLSMLAAQVAAMGDKELASEIMRDAERFVNPAPKNYNDFLLTWMLASGYAVADPDRAFPLLEETIGRANDTLAAFIKVGEFVDVAEEMIQDGEVQVGGFGGQMVRGLTRELGVADATIQVLARADFAKTRNLTNRFERPEIRVLAKMMVLRAVLSPKKPENRDVLIDGVPVTEPDGK